MRSSGLVVGLLLALPGALASAADYHVSSSLGQAGFDGRSGERQGRHGPLPGLQALAGVTLEHGDRVLLRCGDRFTGPWQLMLAGKGRGEVVVQGYGDCSATNKPLIDGRLPLAARASGEIQSFKPAAPVALVFADDEALPVARYPESRYLVLPAQALPDAARVPATPALQGQPLAGATLHARTQEWHLEERRILDDNGRLDAELRYPLRPRTGLFLTGKRWMLGERLAWGWDASLHELHVRARPGQQLAQVPAGPLMQAKGSGSLRVQGLAFDAAGGDALWVHLDGKVQLKDLSIRRAWSNGIAVHGAQVAEVLDNVIEQVGLDAIFFAEARRVLVRGNRVADAGLFVLTRPSLAAINAHRTEEAHIEHNLVDGSAYHGIRFAGAATVAHNVVYRSCRLLSDCGALYTWRRHADDRRPPSRIENNLVVDVRGDTSIKLGVNDWFAGIYIDDFSSDVLVRDNVVVDANQGIYVHNAYGVQVHDNLVRARQRTVIDITDAARVPRVRQLPNRLADNDERLGPFGGSFRSRSGQPRAAGLDDETELVIVPSPTGTAAAATQRCVAASQRPRIVVKECS